MAISTIQNASLASGVPGKANLPSGSVLQVVNFTTTALTSTTSTSLVDTALTTTITPQFATSKILIIIFGQAGTGASSYVRTALLRNSTQLSIMWWAQMYPSGNSRGTSALTYLDTPNTTSATTYKLQVSSPTGNAVQINPDASVDTSSITLMEIAA